MVVLVQGVVLALVVVAGVVGVLSVEEVGVLLVVAEVEGRGGYPRVEVVGGVEVLLVMVVLVVEVEGYPLVAVVIGVVTAG